MAFKWVWLVGLLSVLWLLTTVQAQSLTDAQIALLNDMNALRRAENRVPLVVNNLLDSAAERLLVDVFTRDLARRGNTFQLSDGTALPQMLAEVGYGSYGGIYEVDVMTLILRDFTPPDAVIYWRDNYDSMVGLQTQQMQDGFLDDLPIFFDRFREVGIAYQFNPDNERHYYVFVFAAQPDVFPISITRFDANDLLTATDERQVLVHVPNYIIRGRDLTGATLQGRIDAVRISESPAQEACPPNESAANWERYFKNYPYTLSTGDGLKTLYVQVCDEQGNTLVSTAEIILGNPALVTRTPATDSAGLDPLVLEAVAATQTAAIEATAYAQVLPTVEAVLTATAAAPQATTTP